MGEAAQGDRSACSTQELRHVVARDAAVAHVFGGVILEVQFSTDYCQVDVLVMFWCFGLYCALLRIVSAMERGGVCKGTIKKGGEVFCGKIWGVVPSRGTRA